MKKTENNCVYDIKKIKKLYDLFLKVPISEELLEEFYKDEYDILQIQDFVSVNKKDDLSELYIKAISIIDAVELLYESI